jgi:hypothetical protein
MTPTKEQFELAAKFAGVSMTVSPVNNAAWKLIDADPNYYVSTDAWTPHIPSTDAFNLLCAVLKWTGENPSDGSPHLWQAWTAFDDGQEYGNPEQLAEATFLLAVEIGRSLS